MLEHASHARFSALGSVIWEYIDETQQKLDLKLQNIQTGVKTDDEIGQWLVRPKSYPYNLWGVVIWREDGV